MEHWTRKGGINKGGKRGYGLRNGADISHVGIDSAEFYSKLVVNIINKRKEPYLLYVSLTMVRAPFQDLSKRNSAQVEPNTNIL